MNRSCGVLLCMTFASLDSGLAQDLDALGSLPKLTHLSLLDNEVTKLPNYRRAFYTQFNQRQI